MKNTFKNLKRQGGFTLIEVIVTLVITGIIAVVAVDIIYLQARTYNQVFDRSLLINEARKAVVALRDDVQGIDPSKITSMEADRLTFQNFNGETIDYYFHAGQLDRNNKKLAEYVQTGPFQYLDKDENVTASAADLAFVRVQLNFTYGSNSTQFEELLYVRN